MNVRIINVKYLSLLFLLPWESLEDDGIVIGLSNHGKLLLSLQSVEQGTCLVLLCSEDQVIDLEHSLIHCLQQSSRLLLLLGHHHHRLPLLPKQKGEDLYDLLRGETVSEKIGAYQVVIPHRRFLDLLGGEAKTDHAVHAIIETVLSPVSNHLFPHITNGNAFDLGPLTQSHGRDTHSRLHDQNIFSFEPIGFKNDISGKDDVDVPQFESLQLVREDVQVGDSRFHLETVMQDYVSAPQPKDQLLRRAALGVVAAVGIILVAHYGVNNQSRKCKWHLTKNIEN